MTMTRSVGWLSRPDLTMRPGDAGPFIPTPGAQCPRQFSWEYAVMPFRDREAEGEMIAAAHAFAFPPMLFRVNGQVGGKKSELGILSIDNPRVYASAIRPLPQGGLELRLVNASWKEEQCKLSWGQWWKQPLPVDLKGDPIEITGFEAHSDHAQARLRPGQIMTLRLDKKAVDEGLA